MVKKILPVVDVVISPLVFMAAILLKFVRAAGVANMRSCRRVLEKVGVFPIRDHYYEPQFNYHGASHSFSDDRRLNGIDWNIGGQLAFLKELTHSSELENLPVNKVSDTEFYLNNRSFGVGDAEYWYQIIRKIRPARIFEIGSGNSTLMAKKAIERNMQDSPDYKCKHVCIEPYEMPWLEGAGVSVVRKKVEDIDSAFFSELSNGDILFIDSSHMIRPEGDVLFEFLELLPSLSQGVIVHIHDIFSPRNYPDQWLHKEVRFWNEQYLLEAFLTHNSSWQIVGALNYLHHHYYDELSKVCPNLPRSAAPGSFYIRKVA